MNANFDFYMPSKEEFLRGCEIYNKKEERGPVYFEALKMLSDSWGNASGMAKGISRLIRVWNRFFANFDIDELIGCIDKNINTINKFRERNIASLLENDNEKIRALFNELLYVLRRIKDDAKSAVSVAKALNPLCPDFFPLWDSNIAITYDCFYIASLSAGPYIRFCYKIKIFAERAKYYVPMPDDRSLLKRIDEYNYAKYTMFWLK